MEQHYFEMFRNVYRLPAGTVRYGDKPDVTIGGCQLGIEITNFYVRHGSSPSIEQEQCGLRKKSVSIAQKLYERDADRNFLLTYGFNRDCPILDAAALARKLAELPRRVEGGKNGPITKSVFADIPELEFVYHCARELVYPPYNDPEFPHGQPDISEGYTACAEYENRRKAHALRAGIYKPLSFTAVWHVTQVHALGIMSQMRLAKIIREKEEKVKKYTPCNAFWLLIVVDSNDAAQEQEIRREDGLNIASDVFQKIIVYKPIFEHIVEAP